VIKAVIFDVDGTLVDSNDLHVEAWRLAFRNFGKEVSYEELHEQMGKGSDQLMPVFCSAEELNQFGEELERSRAELFTTEYLPRVRPFPKVRELFERIKAEALIIALASSAKEEELEQHKKSLRIKDLVEAVASADDVKRSKPYPDIFQAALGSLGNVEPQEVVVVGDTPYDVDAATRAGMRTISLLSGGFTQADLQAAGTVEIYQDVTDLLERFDQSLLKTEPLVPSGR